MSSNLKTLFLSSLLIASFSIYSKTQAASLSDQSMGLQKNITSLTSDRSPNQGFNREKRVQYQMIIQKPKLWTLAELYPPGHRRIALALLADFKIRSYT